MGSGSFLLCISKSGVLCVLLFKVHGQTTQLSCVPASHVLFLSLLSHAVEISDNIKHIVISNATCSIITQNHSIHLLLT